MSTPPKSNLVRNFIIGYAVIIIASIVGRTSSGGQIDAQFITEKIIGYGIILAVFLGILWIFRRTQSFKKETNTKTSQTESIQKSEAKMKPKITALIIAIAALGILFLSNPDHASHLQTIRQTSDLSVGNTPRTAWSAPRPTTATDFGATMKYNNYFIFSTVTLINHAVSWGILGKVTTTNRVTDPFGIRK